jgi:hypothetical protein
MGSEKRRVANFLAIAPTLSAVGVFTDGVRTASRLRIVLAHSAIEDHAPPNRSAHSRRFFPVKKLNGQTAC